MHYLKRIQLFKSLFLLFALTYIIINFCFVQTIKAEAIQHTEYFSTEQITTADGDILEKSIISGPPERPIGFVSTTLSSLPLPNIAFGLNTISDVPAFTWCFGCSATSASMVAGYYDRNGYSNMYTGPTTNGKMPLNNDTYWTTWVDGKGATRHRNPLSATQNGLDGRTTKGHVDDYWIGYLEQGPDPFVGNWTEHTHGECTADYMGTNQWATPMTNVDGSTSFWNYSDGSILTAAALYGMTSTQYDDSGLCGVKEFYESRGYTVITAYNQYIFPYGANTIGFTYAQYKAEIDAGRPVMFHVEGHTMVGVGYDDSISNKMFIHDTWGHTVEEMIWGGSYSGMLHYAVTIVVLEASTEPQGGAMPWRDILLLN